jgi:hypothetical protein
MGLTSGNPASLGRVPAEQRVPETRTGRTRLSASRPSQTNGANEEAINDATSQAGARVGNKER